MAYQNFEPLHTFEASGDLSSHQFKFVKLDSNGRVALCDTLGEAAIGVLQNAPTALGGAASVFLGPGVTKVKLGATLSVNASVGVSAAGLAVAAQGGYTRSGVLLQGGVSGNTVPMIYVPGGLVNLTATSARTLTLPAAADYSTTGQYTFVAINSSSQWVRVVTAGGVAQGILQNAPAAGADAIVAVEGVCTVKLGDTVAAAATVMCEVTTGRAIATAVDGTSVGTLITGGVDGDDVQMLLQVGALGHSHT